MMDDQLSDETLALLRHEFNDAYALAAAELNGLQDDLRRRFGMEAVERPSARDVADLRAFVAELRALGVGFETR